MRKCWLKLFTMSDSDIDVDQVVDAADASISRGSCSARGSVSCSGIDNQSHSFGKGLIQAVYGLKHGNGNEGLVLTVARFVTPNRMEIQGKGLTPNITFSNRKISDGSNYGGGRVGDKTTLNVDQIDFGKIQQVRQKMCAYKRSQQKTDI